MKKTGLLALSITLFLITPSECSLSPDNKSSSQNLRSKNSAPLNFLTQAAESRKHSEILEVLTLASETLRSTTPDLESTDPDGRTALHWAVIGAQRSQSHKVHLHYLQITEQLLTTGAGVNSTDRFGNTPLDYQQHPHLTELRELLLDWGASNGYTQKGITRSLQLLEKASHQDLQGLQDLLQADLPANSRLEFRLSTPVSSKSSRCGHSWRGVLTAPVYAEGKEVLPPGILIEGTILRAVPYNDRVKAAELQMDLTGIASPAKGQRLLSASIVAVDNAREYVEGGHILGYSLSSRSSILFEQGLDFASRITPFTAYALPVTRLALGNKLAWEINFPAGTDMTAIVQSPEKLGWRPDSPSWPELKIDSETEKVIQRLPLRTLSKSNTPSDLTNLLFLGDQRQIVQAFTSAGWSDAANLGVTSGLHTFADLMANKGYQRAPVSLLLLNGHPPGLVYQKTNNTFAKRHHIRIWKLPGKIMGQELWLAAATHDIGIGLQLHQRHWIHFVARLLDQEREKVYKDLFFGGGATASALVPRPAAPRTMQNATGDTMVSDGSLRVILLK